MNKSLFHIEYVCVINSMYGTPTLNIVVGTNL